MRRAVIWPSGTIDRADWLDIRQRTEDDDQHGAAGI